MGFRKDEDSDGESVIPQNLVESQEEQRKPRIQRNTKAQRCALLPLQQEAGGCSGTAAKVSLDDCRQGVSVPEEENTDCFHLVAARCFCLAAREHIRHHTFQ